MSRVGIVGTGNVGLATGACLAEMGHTVCCLDVDRHRIAGLRAGTIPLYEPGLEDLVQRNARAGRLRFSVDSRDALNGIHIVFLAMPVPVSADGAADLRYVVASAAQVAHALASTAVVVNVSTSPIGTTDRISGILQAAGPDLGPWSVVYQPAFLREGSAVDDSLRPARIILGSRDPEATDVVASLYRSLSCSIIRTDPYTAEMIRYGSNALLALRISFINQVARMCDALGADISTVATGIGLDPRVGAASLEAGIGYGGSCLPSDIATLAGIATSAGLNPQMLHSTAESNEEQRRWVVARLDETLGGLAGKTVAVLGLAFKPNTDELREAPALDIIAHLAAAGATVRAYDPVAGPAARLGLPAAIASSLEECVADAEAVLVATEWNEFISADWQRIARSMRGTLLFDGRNCLDPGAVTRYGLRYIGVGQPGLAQRLAPARPRVAAVA